jgi:hypothetical protein
MLLEPLLYLHAGATLFMTGLIWFVQVVHYPLFLRVGEAHFRAYSQEHQRRTTLVVAPVMLLEIGTAVALVVRQPVGPERLAAWIGLGLLAAIWLSTALIQVPLHRRLLTSYDPRVVEQLVHSNWFRTFGWTLRAALALWMLRPEGLS